MNSVDAGATVMGLLFMLVVGLLCLLGFLFWVWMLVHAIQNKGLSDSERIVWVVVIVFVNLLGAILYFFVGKPKSRFT